MIARVVSWSCLAIGLVVLACGPRVTVDPDASTPSSPPVALTVAPADQLLEIEGTTAATSDYTATARYEDGRTEDVSDRVQWSLADSTLGTFQGSRFTSSVDKGGTTRVFAQLEGVRGDAELKLRLRKSYTDPGATGLPGDPAAPFNGPADASRAPTLVYPNDGVLLPPNLRLLEIHFRPGADNSLFEIAFENVLTDIKVYTRCTVPMNGGCIYTPDETVWQWIAETNRGDQPLTVRVRGTDDTGTAVGTSADLRIAFSYEDVKGGVYYWKSAGGTTGDSAIMRFDFGDVTQTTAERFVGPDSAGGRCVGCHALSPDGTKMVAAAGGWDVKDILLVDVTTGTRVATPPKTAFASWNPTGTRYVGVYADPNTPTHNLMLFDDAGTFLDTIDVGATPEVSTSHPDWSPDGSRIAFVRAGQAYAAGANNQRFYQGALEMVQDQGGTFGNLVTLLAAQPGKNRYYPGFSPDSRLLAFNESTCAVGTADISCNADSDPSATLFVMKPEPGTTPVALTRANAPAATDTSTQLTNSWPKWAPFEFQRTKEAGSRLMWLTFSSSRNFGLRTPPPSTNDEAVSGTWLWMVAIDPDLALSGQDPSYPAFFLPFQDLSSSNHIAQWTKKVVVLE